MCYEYDFKPFLNIKNIFIRNKYNIFYSNSFQLSVTATDIGSPPFTAPEAATVQITVTRNRNAPQFFNTPYITTIQETEAIGSQIIKVDVLDSDTVVSIKLNNILKLITVFLSFNWYINVFF